MSTDDLKPCPLCRNSLRAIRPDIRRPTGNEVSCESRGCELLGVWLTDDAWQAFPRQSTLTIESTPPDPPANKNHHALHLVAERWDGLIANAIGQNMDTLVLAAFALMAETCRAIASTTCELYAPGQAGSDGHTTCSGRGLPECATCNALEA